MKLTGCTPATVSFSTTRAQGEERLSSPGKSQGEKLCQKLKVFCKSYRICQKHCDNSLKYCDIYLKINCHKNLSKERENMQHFFLQKGQRLLLILWGFLFYCLFCPHQPSDPLSCLFCQFLGTLVARSWELSTCQI